LTLTVVKDRKNTRLAEAIRESGRTQAEIARLVGVHPATVSMWVSGRIEPPVSRALRLAVLLGRSVEELFGHLIFANRDADHRRSVGRARGRR